MENVDNRRYRWQLAGEWGDLCHYRVNAGPLPSPIKRRNYKHDDIASDDEREEVRERLALPLPKCPTRMQKSNPSTPLRMTN